MLFGISSINSIMAICGYSKLGSTSLTSQNWSNWYSTSSDFQAGQRWEKHLENNTASRRNTTFFKANHRIIEVTMAIFDSRNLFASTPCTTSLVLAGKRVSMLTLGEDDSLAAAFLVRRHSMLTLECNTHGQKNRPLTWRIGSQLVSS